MGLCGGSFGLNTKGLEEVLEPGTQGGKNTLSSSLTIPAIDQQIFLFVLFLFCYI